MPSNNNSVAHFLIVLFEKHCIQKQNNSKYTRKVPSIKKTAYMDQA